MLVQLPPELLLQIVSYLRLQDLSVLRQSCQTLNNLAVFYEEMLYRNAAFDHSFISSPSTTLEEAQRWLGYGHKTQNWLSLCRQRFQLEQSWLARGPSVTQEVYWKDGRDGVHRFKIDEEHGFAIATYEDGGLQVLDLRSRGRRRTVLWGLPKSHVHEYAHCEYDHGFLVFDRVDGSKEVWRHVLEQEDISAEKVGHPDLWMRRATIHADRVFNMALAGPRGHFIPWAHLEMPELTHAYHLVFPTLFTAGFNCAFLVDVRTGTITRTIENIRGDTGHSLGRISYVDINAHYAFVAFQYGLRVFTCAHGQLALALTSRQFYSRPNSLEIVSNIRASVVSRPAAVVSQEVLPRRHAEHFFAGRQARIIAVHVSLCGRHLAVLMEDLRLSLIENFARLVNKTVPFDAAVADVPLGPSVGMLRSVYLAVGDGRFSAVTSCGIFIITLDTERHANVEETIIPQDGPFPRLGIATAPIFLGEADLLRVSCLQMTNTGLWFNWRPRIPTILLETHLPEKTSAPSNAQLSPSTASRSKGIWSIASSAVNGLPTGGWATRTPLGLGVSSSPTSRTPLLLNNNDGAAPTTQSSSSTQVRTLSMPGAWSNQEGVTSNKDMTESDRFPIHGEFTEDEDMVVDEEYQGSLETTPHSPHRVSQGHHGEHQVVEDNSLTDPGSEGESEEELDDELWPQGERRLCYIDFSARHGLSDSDVSYLRRVLSKSPV